MDAAEEMDDDRAGCRTAGRAVLGEEHVGQQHAQAGAGVCLEHVHDRLACLSDLLRADRREHAVVDRIIEEQYLGRLEEHGNQRQQAVVHQERNAGGQHAQDRAHDRADRIIANDGKDHAENADREIVDQHFKAGRHTALHGLVKLFDDPARERAHDHRAHQHRLAFRSVNARDAAHDCDCTHDASAVAADHLAALRRDQHRQQEGEHKRLDGCQIRIRDPAGVDKQSRDKAPGDKSADIRHDHGAEEFAKSGNRIFHTNSNSFFSFSLRG